MVIIFESLLDLPETFISFLCIDRNIREQKKVAKILTNNLNIINQLRFLTSITFLASSLIGEEFPDIIEYYIRCLLRDIMPRLYTLPINFPRRMYLLPLTNSIIGLLNNTVLPP